MTETQNPIIKPKPWWLAWAWWAKGSTITIYPCIYSTETPISSVCLAHELVHFEQQKKAGNRVWWFLEYILLPSFRKEVELEAYTATLRYYLNHQQLKPIIRAWLIRELSGWTYLRMMSQAEAKKWVEETVEKIKKEG